MALAANQAIKRDQHSDYPPCDCDACLQATAAADSRRAEIAEILDRVEWLDLLTSGDDEPGGRHD